MKLLNLLRVQKNAPEEEIYRNLIRREAKIGGTLFGPVRPDARREFFCLDEHTWIWHEEWTDDRGQRKVVTTRYDVRPNGIFKAQDGQAYRPLSLSEMQNLYQASQHYTLLVNSTLYSQAA